MDFKLIKNANLSESAKHSILQMLRKDKQVKFKGVIEKPPEIDDHLPPTSVGEITYLLFEVGNLPTVIRFREV